MTITDTAPRPATDSSAPPPTRKTTTRRAPAIAAIVMVSVGLLLVIAGVALGGVLTVRDRAGFFHSDTGTLRSDGYAATSQPADFGPADPDVPAVFDDMVTLRVRATSTAVDGEVFIGVAPQADVDRYLSGVAHDVVTDLETDPFRATTRSVTGTVSPSAPGAQTFWVTSTSGTGEQELRWHPGDTDWTVVVMNADGSRHVVTQADVGVRVGWLPQFAVGFGALGALLVLSGGAIWFTVARRPAS